MSHATVWTGLLCDLEGPLRVGSGHGPLGMLSRELAKEGGKEVGEKRGEGKGGNVGEESPPNCLDHFPVSVPLHALFLGPSCCPMPALLVYLTSSF